MKRIEIPLDGLGMDEKAMFELVNRMNEHDDRKWVFYRGHPYSGQMLNRGMEEVYKSYSAHNAANNQYANNQYN